MFEKLDACPICESLSQKNLRIIKDYSITKEKFALVQCGNCSFVFTNPRPSEENLSKYYESEEYISHHDKSNNLINLIYGIARKFTLKWKGKIVNRYIESGSILDIGCGTGHFLSHLKKQDWSVKGIEPDDTARNYATRKLGAETLHRSLKEISSDVAFDIITMWHVLEHVNDLNYYLSTIKSILSRKGTFIVAVPNHKSYDAKYYDSHWAGYDVPRHFYHFTQDSMALLAKKHSFKIKSTIPMRLDAYYVSLLSEKFRSSGWLTYFRALITAYNSNSYAKKNNNGYSSLIFVMQHK